MRKQLPETLADLMRQDERLYLLVADFGSWAMRDIFAEFPTRAINIGIREQAMIGIAAGLSKAGFIPVVYGIAPFIIERAYEQIKIDLGYNRSKTILISAGGSFDYAAEGPTHHCPADVGILYNIPGIDILLPGTPHELDALLRQAVNNNNITYIRLSTQRNVLDYPVEIGKAILIQSRDDAVVIAVGTALGPALNALDDLNATILYYPCAVPFDGEMLRKHYQGQPLMVIEPYYSTLALEILNYIQPSQLVSVGVPREFIHIYGTREELEIATGLNPGAIRLKYWEMLEWKITLK